ncbi:hypothetical protein [Halorarum salinum]|uniref:hypothetical protein n=1 Tax=Halorarum salinum TaxID=2743089 RepID=UPI0031F2F2B6
MDSWLPPDGMTGHVHRFDPHEGSELWGLSTDASTSPTVIAMPRRPIDSLGITDSFKHRASIFSVEPDTRRRLFDDE